MEQPQQKGGETPRKQKQENKIREEGQEYICQENEELLTPARSMKNII